MDLRKLCKQMALEQSNHNMGNENTGTIKFRAENVKIGIVIT